MARSLKKHSLYVSLERNAKEELRLKKKLETLAPGWRFYVVPVSTRWPISKPVPKSSCLSVGWSERLADSAPRAIAAGMHPGLAEGSGHQTLGHPDPGVARHRHSSGRSDRGPKEKAFGKTVVL